MIGMGLYANLFAIPRPTLWEVDLWQVALWQVALWQVALGKWFMASDLWQVIYGKLLCGKPIFLDFISLLQSAFLFRCGAYVPMQGLG